MLLTACVMYNNYLWLQRGEVQFLFDFPAHAMTAFAQADHLRKGDAIALMTPPDASPHGPFGYQAAAVSLVFFGTHIKNIMLSSIFWIPLYVLAIFVIGRQLYDDYTGFMAAVYFLSLPEFVAFGKQFPLEMVFHALMMLALMLLYQSDMLRRPLSSALFGLVLALSYMTKAEFPGIWGPPLLALGLIISFRYFRSILKWTLFLAVCLEGALSIAFLYAEWQPVAQSWMLSGQHFIAYVSTTAVIFGALAGIRAWHAPSGLADRQAASSRFWNLALALGLMCSLGLPYALARDIRVAIKERIWAASYGTLPGNVRPDLATFVSETISRLYGPAYAVLLLIGLIWFLCSRQYRDSRKLFLFSFFWYVAALVFVATARFEIYVFNVLGLSAIFAVAWIPRTVWVRVGMGMLMAGFAGLQIFGWLPLPQQGLASMPLRHFSDPHAFSFLPILPDSPSQYRSPIEMMLQDVGRAEQRPFAVAPVMRLMMLNTLWRFHLYGKSLGVPVVCAADAAQYVLEIKRLEVAGSSAGSATLSDLLNGVPVYLVVEEGASALSPEELARKWLGADVPVGVSFFGNYAFVGSPPLTVYRLSAR